MRQREGTQGGWGSTNPAGTLAVRAAVGQNGRLVGKDFRVDDLCRGHFHVSDCRCEIELQNHFAPDIANWLRYSLLFFVEASGNR